MVPSSLSAKYRLPPFAALRAFEAYGRAGSVRRAGELLGVDQAIVSRHLRALEDRIGVPLINRPRGGLTTRGQEYHRDIAAAFAALEEATQHIVRAGQTSVRIWSVPGFAYHWLTERLGRFRALHPDIIVNLKPSDVAADFAKDDADADIRFIRRDAAGVGPDTRCVELATPPVFAVASPALDIQATTVAELIDAPLLLEDNDIEWRLWFSSHGMTFDQIPYVSQLWHAHLTLAAARAGQGIALANDFIAGRHLADGSLTRVGSPPLPAAIIGAYMLLMPQRDETRPVALLREWLVAETANFRSERVSV